MTHQVAACVMIAKKFSSLACLRTKTSRFPIARPVRLNCFKRCNKHIAQRRNLYHQKQIGNKIASDMGAGNNRSKKVCFLL